MQKMHHIDDMVRETNSNIQRFESVEGTMKSILHTQNDSIEEGRDRRGSDIRQDRVIPQTRNTVEVSPGGKGVRDSLGNGPDMR